MKKILQNPIVVLLLVAVSIFYMYWNVLRPIMGWDNTAQIKVSNALDPQENDDDNNDNPQVSSDNELIIQYDSTVVNNWQPDWVFEYTRDPFRIEKRSRSIQHVDLRPKPPKPRYRPRYRPRSEDNYIQAISIGTKDTLALINGKTIKIQDLDPSFKDTVSFILNDQKKKYIFKPKANP